MLLRCYLILSALVAAALCQHHSNVGLLYRWNGLGYDLCTGTLLAVNGTVPIVVTTGACVANGTEFNFTLDASANVSCAEDGSVADVTPHEAVYRLVNATTFYSANATSYPLQDTGNLAVLRFAENFTAWPAGANFGLTNATAYYNFYYPASVYMKEDLPDAFAPWIPYMNATVAVRYELEGYGLGAPANACSSAWGVRSNSTVLRLFFSASCTATSAENFFAVGGAALFAVDPSSYATLCTMALQIDTSASIPSWTRATTNVVSSKIKAILSRYTAIRYRSVEHGDGQPVIVEQ